jgi:hypothetical protein
VIPVTWIKISHAAADMYFSHAAFIQNTQVGLNGILNDDMESIQKLRYVLDTDTTWRCDLKLRVAHTQEINMSQLPV